MPTRADYIAKGYTDQQIDTAFQNKVTTGQKTTGVTPGVPAQPTFQASVTPIGMQTTEGAPQQPQAQAKTNLNAPVSPVSTPQATSAPVDSGNILAVRANQTPEEKAWQAKQDAFDQARTGVNPAPAVQVEKTTTITPEGETVVKKETPTTDFNVGVGREQEILKNLNEGFANSPDLFQNQDTFRTSYGYATADDTKKRMLDAFFQAKSAQQNNPDALFQQIVSNQTIQNPAIRNTPAFKAAQTRASDLTINSGLTAKELSDQIKNGSITIGSQAYKDLQVNNPQLVANAERLNAVNTGNGQRIETNTIEANVGNNIIKNVPKEEVPNLQNMLANNEQVKSALDTSKATKSKVDTIQDTLDNLEEDIKKQYEGKDVTAGYLQALISEKSKPLIRELNTLNRTYSNQLAELQFYSDIVKSDYADQKAQRADERNFQQQKEIATFQNALATESKKLDYAYQNSRDVQNFKQDLQKMGITDALQINRDKLNFDQQKEFAAIQNKYQNSRDVQNYAQDINKLAFQYNNDPSNVSKNIENMKAIPVSPLAPQLLSIPDGESVPNTRSQCGQYVNDVLGTPGLFKDSIEDKMKVATDTEPTIGGAVVLSSNGEFAKYGHVGIVTAFDDNTITVKSSNRDGDGKISTDVMNRNYSRIKGYYNPSSKAPALSKTEKADVKTARTDMESDPQYKAYRTLANQIGDVSGILSRIKSKTASPQDQQQLITAFSKVLDPTSVVRESEFEITRKYGQSGLASAFQTAKHFWDGSGILTAEGAKILAESLSSRYDSIGSEYNNVLRNAKKNIEFNLGRELSDEEFNIITQTNFAGQGQSQGNNQAQAQNPTDVDALLNEWNTRNQ